MAQEQIVIPYKEIEEISKEIIDKDWSRLQDNLWSMIERQHLYNFIQKAEKWFYEQFVKGNISTNKVSMDSLVENFKHTMLL